MARDIDRKLRATAAVLGLITRKDLAAAFRRVNAATAFDIERAHKWLQGRSHPRDARIYQDWAHVLDIDRSAEWIANSEFDEFLEVVATRHKANRETLSLQGRPRHSEHISGANEVHSGLPGTYVCYSHAWSPYFRGQMIRGALSIVDGASASVRQVTYSEVLPTGRLQMNGSLVLGNRALLILPKEPTGVAQFVFCLFPPTVPVRVLGGLMCGTTVISSEPSPSVSRVIMIRLPAPSEHLHSVNAYLPKGVSFAQDLVALGLPVSLPQMVDERLSGFLCSGDGEGLDQPSMATYRIIVELFDREWLSQLNEDFDTKSDLPSN